MGGLWGWLLDPKLSRGTWPQPLSVWIKSWALPPGSPGSESSMARIKRWENPKWVLNSSFSSQTYSQLPMPSITSLALGSQCQALSQFQERTGSSLVWISGHTGQTCLSKRIRSPGQRLNNLLITTWNPLLTCHSVPTELSYGQRLWMETSSSDIFILSSPPSSTLSHHYFVPWMAQEIYELIHRQNSQCEE